MSKKTLLVIDVGVVPVSKAFTHHFLLCLLSKLTKGRFCNATQTQQEIDGTNGMAGPSTTAPGLPHLPKEDSGLAVGGGGAGGGVGWGDKLIKST